MSSNYFLTNTQIDVELKRQKKRRKACNYRRKPKSQPKRLRADHFTRNTAVANYQTWVNSIRNQAMKRAQNYFIG